MQCARMTRGQMGRKAILLAMGLALLPWQGGMQPALAKRAGLALPSYEKLNDGSGPETNDVSPKSQAGTSGGGGLAPVTLDGSPQPQPGADNGTDNNGMIKATVTRAEFVPKGPVDPSGRSIINQPKSISDKLGTTLMDKAKQNKLAPTPLLMSDEEAEKKVETMVDAEKQQLAELWESALSRSPDIQFVIQKLMPTSNPGHGATIIMRMLSTAVYGGMGAMQMMMPNAAGYMLSGTGGSAIMNVLNAQESKQAKNARLSQTETIMLYNMVRTTADKLVDNFRNYKKTLGSIQKASTDLQDLQGMVSEARSGQDSAKQLEMEYTVRRQQRDVDAINEDLRRFRQGLVDLSGPEAVAKLDKQIEDEQNKIEQVVPANAPSSDQSGSQNQQTAGKLAPARG